MLLNNYCNLFHKLEKKLIRLKRRKWVRIQSIYNPTGQRRLEYYLYK